MSSLSLGGDGERSRNALGLGCGVGRWCECAAVSTSSALLRFFLPCIRGHFGLGTLAALFALCHGLDGERTRGEGVRVCVKQAVGMGVRADVLPVCVLHGKRRTVRIRIRRVSVVAAKCWSNEKGGRQEGGVAERECFAWPCSKRNCHHLPLGKTDFDKQGGGYWFSFCVCTSFIHSLDLRSLTFLQQQHCLDKWWWKA